MTTEKKVADKAAKAAAKAEKDAMDKATVSIYEASELVIITGTGQSKHLHEGVKYTVTGYMANKLIEKGAAKAI